jgi:hypothetical protein
MTDKTQPEPSIYELADPCIGQDVGMQKDLWGGYHTFIVDSKFGQLEQADLFTYARETAILKEYGVIE